MTNIISQSFIESELNVCTPNVAFEPDNLNSSEVTEDTRANISSSTICNGFLVISYHEFKLGLAFYRQHSELIELLHEVYEYYDFSFIKSVLRKVDPTDVIVNAKCDPYLLNYLKTFSHNFNESTDYSFKDEVCDNNIESDSISPDYLYHQDPELRYCGKFKLHIRSNRIFHFEQCKSRIVAMNLPQMAGMIDRKERFIYLTSHINFSEVNTVKSLGVLLYFIEKNSNTYQLYTNYNNDIVGFKYFNLDYVTMDQTTFEALEIFQQEWHPSVSKKGIYKKEGLSLYGIFNTCSSKVGSFQLRKIFQQPISDYNLIDERLSSVEYFINPINKDVKDILLGHLKNIKDISSILKHLESSNFQTTDLQILLNVTISMISIRNLARKLNNSLQIFDRIRNVFNTKLDEIASVLQSTIDFDTSFKTKNVELYKGIDQELDDLKTIFNKLPEVLQNALMEDSAETSLLALSKQNMTNIYIPQIGFLVSLPLLEAQCISDPNNYGLELVFCADDKVYYKNHKMKEFDSHFGDIKSEIIDRTHQLLLELKKFILYRSNALNSSILLCAQLDALIAMAQAAINYNYVRPIFTCSGTIKIEAGRHPLYELVEKSFMPNDFVSGEEESKINIIFGNRSCGKSVYLKQVSLIVYLAHIGSFVPAKYAEVSIIDQIFTRIRTPESISTQLSSFKQDLNQIIMATKYAMSRSLVVIDFFGKGTLSIDGRSLLIACLNYWIRSVNCPHLILSSQFNLSDTSLHMSKKVKFHAFISLSGVNIYQLVECNAAYQTQNKQTVIDDEAIAMLEPLQQRINDLIDSESLLFNMQKSFPELQEKYKQYLQLADFILAPPSENTLVQIEQLVQLISSTYSMNI